MLHALLLQHVQTRQMSRSVQATWPNPPTQLPLTSVTHGSSQLVSALQAAQQGTPAAPLTPLTLRQQQPAWEPAAPSGSPCWRLLLQHVLLQPCLLWLVLWLQPWQLRLGWLQQLQLLLLLVVRLQAHPHPLLLALQVLLLPSCRVSQWHAWLHVQVLLRELLPPPAPLPRPPPLLLHHQLGQLP
jgi:hypothetical protein